MERASCIRKRIPAILSLLCLLSLGGCGRDKIAIRQEQRALPADGRWYTIATLQRKSRKELDAKEIAIRAPEPSGSAGVLIEQADAQALSLLIEAPVNPGKGIFAFDWRGQDFSISVQFVPSGTDSYGDGTPDFLRLHSVADRAAFRAWFTGLAETEAERPHGSLPAEIDDCAALLRFAYREALARHDARWFLQQPAHTRLLELASISQYHYPRTPLGAALFRVRPGSFTWPDLKNGSFAQFADAHALLEWNTHFISRDLCAALPGDLLFFRQLGQDSPYHSMILIGRNAEWAIYHTGPSNTGKGEIRRVAVEDLVHHPDARWRPVPGNSNFLGVYRWNILRDGD